MPQSLTDYTPCEMVFFYWNREPSYKATGERQPPLRDLYSANAIVCNGALIKHKPDPERGFNMTTKMCLGLAAELCALYHKADRTDTAELHRMYALGEDK